MLEIKHSILEREQDKMNLIYKHAFLVLMIILSSTFAKAEQKEVFDGPNGSEYEVHYIGFASTILDAEIAQQYQLVRSRALGIINISIIKIEADGKRKAVGAAVEIKMMNNIQQAQFLSSKQVVEGKAIYYLSQLQYKEGELLTFDVTIYPEGRIAPIQLRFSQNFYND
ncbi:MAG: DUF4426 domain-containing protein [Cycloclasticus sp.]|nr:DUF4426 domain-containing protein [Cycloclasticus sp.]